MDDDWVCATCRSVNRAGLPRCYRCHEPRADSEPVDAQDSQPVDAQEGAAAGSGAAVETTEFVSPSLRSSERRPWLPALVTVAGAAAIALAVSVLALTGGWPLAGGASDSATPSGQAGAASTDPASPALPSPSASGADAGTSSGAAAPSGATTPSGPTATPSDPATAPSPEAATRVAGGAVGGTWRVRIEPAAPGMVNLIGQASFQDRVLDIRPECPAEPCRSVSVRVFLMRDPRPSYAAQLDRRDDSYVSSPETTGTADCLAPSGTRIPAGATVTRTISVWLERTTRPGTAVTLERVGGEVTYAGTPNLVGMLAGCEAWTATYTLRAMAPWTVPGAARPGGTVVGDESAMVPLPSLSYPIDGARVRYFPVSGATAVALVESLMSGALRTCGEIEYDWVEPDVRPAGCMEMVWDDDMVNPRTDPATGDCSLEVTESRPAYVVHLPRWTEPELVPEPLLDWWRELLAFIGEHEASHVAIYQQHVDELPARLDGVACTGAQSAIEGWASEVTSAQEAFDRREYALPAPTPPFGY